MDTTLAHSALVLVVLGHARLAVRIRVAGRSGAAPRRLDLGVGRRGHREQVVDVLGVVRQRVAA